MDKTLALNKLAALLAAKSGHSAECAEKFIRLFFSQIENALTVSGEVNVKGLGRFYRTSDNNNPVGFEIDRSLAAKINSPFDMFEAVKIPEGFDINSIETEQTIAQQQIDPEPIIDEPIAKEPITKEEPIAEESVETSIEKVVEQPFEEPVDESIDETVDDTIDEPFDEPYDVCDEHSSGKKYFLFAVLAFVLGIAIGYFANEYLFNDRHNDDNETKETATTPDVTIGEVEMTALHESFLADSTDIRAESTDHSETSLDINVENDEIIYDTVSTNRFLTTMARQYYGQMEYWAFIYQANDSTLRHPNRIAPGTRVVIPAKESFIIKGESPEQTIERAKKLGEEIYARYE